MKMTTKQKRWDMFKAQQRADKAIARGMRNGVTKVRSRAERRAAQRRHGEIKPLRSRIQRSAKKRGVRRVRA